MVKGPETIIVIPERKLSSNNKNLIEKLLDLDSNGFFTHHSSEEDISLANYSFTIKSKWARGNVETILLSLITDPDQKPEIFKNDIENCVKKFKNEINLFKAFYVNDPSKKDAQISKSEIKMKSMLAECYEKCKRNPNGQKPGRMSILGLSEVGKTSIIKRLNNDFSKNIKPTLGVQIIKSVIDNFAFKICDVGGQKSLRKDWFPKPSPHALIYVIDCSAKKEQHLEEKKEFDRVIKHYFSKKSLDKMPKGAPILILGNKIDLKSDYNEKKIEKLLKPKSFKINYKIGVVSALNNVGMEENFKWLTKAFLYV